jgi:DNA-binding transcriptional MerR regulator
MKDFKFPISVIAEALNTHQRTLRIWETEGILIPSRSPKGRRLYTIADIERAKLIQYCTKELGLNLNGVKMILIALDELPENEKEQELKGWADKAGISKEEQQINKDNNNKRGRKKSV